MRFRLIKTLECYLLNIFFSFLKINYHKSTENRTRKQTAAAVIQKLKLSLQSLRGFRSPEHSLDPR